jgi:hypothetical protein
MNSEVRFCDQFCSADSIKYVESAINIRSDGLSEESGIHRSDQHKAGWVGEGGGCPSDRHSFLL